MNNTEDIDREWLNENFVREPYCWALPIAGYCISETTTGFYRGRFDVFGVEDDGDETTYGQVARKGELANMLKLIAAKEAIREIRDNVLHERNQMAEAGFDSDQVNAVLGIIDDAASNMDYDFLKEFNRDR